MDRKGPYSEPADKVTDSSMGKMFDTFMPEVIKRALFTGAGMLFMTEEGVRRALGEFNLPREAVNYFIKQSERSKEELFGIVQRELNRFLSRIDISRMTKDVVDGISLEIHTTITFRTKPDDEDAFIAKLEHFEAAPRKKTATKKKRRTKA